MKNADGKKENLGLRNRNATWNQWSAYILALGIVFGLFLSVAFQSTAPMAIGIFVGFAGLASFKALATEPGSKHVWLELLLPVAIGVSLAIYPFANPVLAILGVGVAVVRGWWLSVGRYPAQFRAATKAFRSGDYARSINLANQALNVKPGLWEAYQLRAAAYLKLSNSREAERDARKVLQLKPDNHAGLTALGNALIARQKYEEATSLFSRALELAPQIGLNHYNVGVMRYRQGDFAGAVQQLQIAADTGMTGDVPFLGHYYLAESLSRLGDTRRAEQHYAAMKKYRAIYEKLVKEAADAPDYPNVVVWRAELQNMSRHMN